MPDYKDWRLWCLGLAPYASFALFALALNGYIPPSIGALAVVSGGASIIFTFGLAPLIPFVLAGQMIDARSQ